MKEFKLRLMLLVLAVAFVSQVSTAQSTEPAIKMRTEQKDGFTIEYYDKNGKQYTLWKKNNGDYYLSDNGENNWLSYCHFTLSDGTVVDGNNDYYLKGGQNKLGTGTDINSFVGVKVKFPNGNYYLLNGAPIKWFKWSKGTCKDLLSEYDRKYHHLYYVFADSIDKLLPFDKNSTLITIGNKIYYIDEKDGNLTIRYIIFKYIKPSNREKVKRIFNRYLDYNSRALDRLSEVEREKEKSEQMEEIKRSNSETYKLPVTSHDSVTSIIYDGDNPDNNQKIKITYVNGDEVYIDAESGNLLDSTHIHKNNGLLEYKDNQVYFTLKDGRKFRAESFKEINAIHTESILAFDSLTPWYGLMINTDNTGVNIVEGLSKEEKAAKEEAERKKAEAEKEKKEREQYSILCKKFGKTYVDAALKGKVVIGMPELLLVATFKPTLKQETANKKLYYIYEIPLFSSNLKKIVWVTNGKVSSIRNVN